MESIVKNNVFKIENDSIEFLKSGNAYSIKDYTSMEVKTMKVDKSAGSTILNATATAVSGSLANGEELVNVCIKITFTDNRSEQIVINDEPVVRFSLDYHEYVREARKIEASLKEKLH